MASTRLQARPVDGLNQLVFFMASSGLYQASRLGVNVVAAAILSPAIFGIWSLVVVLQTYATHGSLGVLSGANRRVPLLLGAARATEARAVESSALGGSIVSGCLLAAAAVVAGIVIGGQWTTAGLLAGLAVLSQQLYLCGQVILRGNLDFNRASAQQLILAIAFPAIGLPAIIAGGINGLIAAQAVAYGLGAGIVLAWRRDVRPALDAALLRSLVREGAPIMLSGLLFAIMTSVDRWAVVTAGTDEELGHYALASTISASMMFVNLVVAQQLYPRMAHAYGARGDARAIRPIAVRQGLLAGGLVLGMASVLAVAAPIIVPIFLPAYSASIGALQLLGFAYAILALASGFTNLLVTVGKAWQLLVLHAAMGVIGAMLCVAVLRAGLGLAGVAGAMLATFLLLGLTAAGLGLRASAPRTNVG